METVLQQGAVIMTMRLFIFCFVCGIGTLLAEEIPVTSEVPARGPHFTGCRSREQETFRCWWSPGSYQNLTEPGALRVFFQKRDKEWKEWKECPDYSSSTENECYFDKNYTSIWTSYCIQLRSRTQDVTYDEQCFTVEDIVYPDPPIGLNWTLLNVSLTGQHFDILIRWESPPSADVKSGWMSLVYEAQYRVVNVSEWIVMDIEKHTYQSIYGLKTNTEYEVRVRCRMPAFDNFGEFSDPITVYIPQIPTKESTFPVAFVFIFGAVGVAILLMLIVFSQQQRLMVIFLPPVPVPKIKGIDPELLKKGKLDELNSIFTNHHTYKPELYTEDLWVEFIELDIDEPGEKMERSSTHKLLDLAQLNNTNALSIKDDDSGRASCYDPELPDTEAVPFSLTQLEALGENAGLLESESHAAVPRLSPSNYSAPESSHPAALPAASRAEGRPVIQTQLSNQSWVNMDFYAQVSDITPAGGVLLSPGQQCKAEKASEKENPLKDKKCQFAMVPVSAYTSETDAKQIGAIPSRDEHERSREKGFAQESCSSAESQPVEPQGPCGAADSSVASPPCLSDYTLVQAVDSQQSLLLNPTVVPTGARPVPVGYFSPDLLGNITP
nr:PREDICTED: growth hormone receptor isoform X2 [Lepisosteus oculatus]